MTLTDLPERAEFAGFEAFFSAAIKPYLASCERDRKRAVNLYVALLAASAAAAGAVFVSFAFLGDLRIQLAIIALFLGAAGATYLLNRARKDITHGLLERIAGKLGLAYRGALERPSYFDRFKRLKMLPDHNREEWEDEVQGDYRGAQLVFCEAHLKYKSSGKNSSTRTVFHGQLFVIDYPKRFLGSTVVQRDAGMLNALRKPGKEFSRVGLVSAEFEKAFEAWTTDQVEARDLLDPLVLERFQELERLFQGKQLRAAFDDGKLLIAIETGDRLGIGTMFRSIEGPDRVATILREFDTVFDIVDVIMKRVDKRLPGALSLKDIRDVGRS